jgi:hypothetical protein
MYSKVALALAVVVVAGLAVTPPARAQGTGVLLVTSTEQIPLKAYAEFMATGLLRLTSGSESDIPTVEDFRFIRCSITGWRPVNVLVASAELFTSEYAERRLLPIALRPVGVTAVAVRVADLERPERVAELHSAVGVPEGGDDAYFFLVLAAEGLTRFYPFRIRTTP